LAVAVAAFAAMAAALAGAAVVAMAVRSVSSYGRSKTMETMRKATTENGLRERRLTDVALSEVRARGGNSTNCFLFALQWGRGSFPIPEYDRIKILIPKTSCKGLIGFSGLPELIAQFRRPTPPDQPQRRKKGSSIYSFGGAVDHDDKTNGLRIS